MRSSKHFSVAIGVACAIAVAASSLLLARSAEDEGPSRTSFGGTPIPVPSDAWVTFPEILSVREAIQTRDGWLLMDPRASQIHVLSDAGVLTSSFGRRGEGPGELQYLAGMALIADTVWVVNVAGTRADGFTLDGTFLRRLRPEPPCGTPYLDDAVATGRSLILAVRCFGLGGFKRHLIRIDPSSGSVRPIAWPGGDDAAPSGDPTRMVSTPGGLLVGSMFQRCLRPTDAGGPAPQCLDSADRIPLPRAILDSQQAAATRRLPPGFRRSAPPHYPYLVDALQTSRGFVVVQPEGENTAVVRLLGPGSTTLRAPDRILPFLGRTRILLVEEVLEGVRIALAQLPGEPP